MDPMHCKIKVPSAMENQELPKVHRSRPGVGQNVVYLYCVKPGTLPFSFLPLKFKLFSWLYLLFEHEVCDRYQLRLYLIDTFLDFYLIDTDSDFN